MCDARDYEVGAILGQWKNNIFHSIYYASRTLNEAQLNYASRTLNEAQLNYATTKEELLAIVFAFDKF